MIRLQTLLVLLTISCASILLTDTVPGQIATAQSNDVMHSVATLGFNIVLPSYIPSGFRLTSFKEEKGFASGYNAKYEGPNSCSIRIRAADAGWGAGGPMRQWSVYTKPFRQVILEEVDNSRASQPNYLNASVSPKDGNGNRWTSRAGRPYDYGFNFSCSRSLFSVKEALKVMKSLQFR